MNAAVYKGRVRTGCFPCRTSKVKCDEQHPTCRRCLKQQKRCIYAKKRNLPVPLTIPASTQKRTASADPRSNTWTAPEPVDPERAFGQENTQGSLISSSPHDGSTPRQHHGEYMIPSKTPSTGSQSPSLLSTLISQDIYLCTTIDLLAAEQGYPSFSYFHQEVESPFITPYDPVNWTDFKSRVLDIVPRSTPVAAATTAVQSIYRAQKYCLSHTKALSSYRNACEIFDSILSDEHAYEDFDLLLTTAFLLCLVEMLLPEETEPGPFSRSHGAFVEQLETWSASESDKSPLCLRIASWLLISHAAARRSGNGGLLSRTVHSLLESTYNRNQPLPSINVSHSQQPDKLLLSTLSEPLFAFYTQLQLFSAYVADLSHYHRSRTTGTDQEEVSMLMAALKARIQALWQSRPTLMRHPATELRTQFTSSAIAKPLILLVTLCTLTYHTELVEMGRNLSAEQVPSSEARTHLGYMRDIMSSPDCQAATTIEDSCLDPAFLRHLFLYAIESTHESDTSWAVSQMRRMKNPVCYSEMFANFAAGLSEIQRRKERRVTTKWWCLQAFGVNPPYL